jgi:hypothetical protein
VSINPVVLSPPDFVRNKDRMVRAWILLAIVGTLALLIGGADVVNRALGFQPRLVGFLFVVAGFLMVLSALQLRAVVRKAATLNGNIGTSFLIGCAAGAGLTFYFFLALIAGRGATGWLAIIVALVLSIEFLRLLIFGVRDLQIPFTATAGLVISFLVGAFGIYQFWYTQQYAPATQVSVANVTPTLESGATVDGKPSVQVSVTIANPSAVSANVLATEWQLSRSNPTETNVPMGSELNSAFLENEDPIETYYVARSSTDDLVAAGRIVGDTYFLAPNETATRQWVVELPRSLLGTTLRLTANVAFVNSLQIPPATTYPTPNYIQGDNGHDYVVEEIPVAREALIQQLVTAPREAIVEYDLASRPQILTAYARMDRVEYDSKGLPSVNDRDRSGAFLFVADSFVELRLKGASNNSPAPGGDMAAPH